MEPLTQVMVMVTMMCIYFIYYAERERALCIVESLLPSETNNKKEECILAFYPKLIATRCLSLCVCACARARAYLCLLLLLLILNLYIHMHMHVSTINLHS